MDRVITVRSLDPQEGVILEVLVHDNVDACDAKQFRCALYFITGPAACLRQQSDDIECGSLLDLHWSLSYRETIIGDLENGLCRRCRPNRPTGFFLGYSTRWSTATFDGCPRASWRRRALRQFEIVVFLNSL